MKAIIIALATIILNHVAFAGEPVGSSDYSVNEVRQVGKVMQGTVIDMRSISLHEKPRDQQAMYGYGNPGTALGGLVGGLVGNNMSGGIAGFLGATAGGMIGNAVYNEVTSETQTHEGVEVLIQMDDNNVIAVTQGVDGVNFIVGGRVNVIQNASGTRIWKSNRTVSQVKQ
jgi:outer membrane lipoprotein SlyB